CQIPLPRSLTPPPSSLLRSPVPCPTGGGDRMIYDAVGRDTFDNSFDCLGRFGHLVSYGQASGDIGPIDISKFAAKSARLSRPNFTHYTDSREKVTDISGKLFAAIRERVVRPGHRAGVSARGGRRGAPRPRVARNRQLDHSLVLMAGVLFL